MTTTLDHDQQPVAHGHPHASLAATINERKLAGAALLTGVFMVAEFIGGVISGSLALIADAGHMLADFAALTLAWFAQRIGRRPATWQQSYGFDRFSVLAAFVNGLVLFVVAGWICWEAYARLRSPGAVLGGLMIWVAVAGLVVNIAAFWILSRGAEANLNVRAATLHVVGDLLGSIAAAGAAIVILTTGWTPIDPLLSVFVALIIVRAAWSLVRESGHILLEGAPAHLDRNAVTDDLLTTVAGVRCIDHIHAWSITEERPMITLEAEAEAEADVDAIRLAIKARLKQRFRVDHATVEVHTQRAAAPAREAARGC